MPASHSATGDTSPTVEALEKNKAARETVKEAAEDLAVVHTVLETEVPPAQRSDELDQAVSQTDHLQKKLDETAEVLHEVNQALESEAAGRRATKPSGS